MNNEPVLKAKPEWYTQQLMRDMREVKDYVFDKTVSHKRKREPLAHKLTVEHNFLYPKKRYKSV